MKLDNFMNTKLFFNALTGAPLDIYQARVYVDDGKLQTLLRLHSTTSVAIQSSVAFGIPH